ncbi:MAG: N-succinylglutamate 5-semialdehyde dehydrogenase [Halobacteriovoraceae bacterium]|nr:N-succinylglutamate 5-semialdehyde dehydrogenase [Halobacteriovoraceae bacterium]
MTYNMEKKLKYELKGNYFNGEFHRASLDHLKDSVSIIKKYCPADLENLLWELPIEYSQIDEVLDSAQNGFSFWKTTSIEERISLVKKYQEIVLSKEDKISEAIALETGKPLWEAKTEAKAVAGKATVTIEKSLERISSKEYSQIMPNTDGSLTYHPIGPCFVIGPFNFPCHLANGQILNSLISGNSIIFKPSEKTCYSGQLLIDCFHEAGFPKGVINLVQGDGETASRILKEKSIKGVFFTGSKEVGIKILKNTYEDLSKLVALELGGKNSSIVHKDANLDLVMPELLKACYMTTGQRCVSTSLVPIHSSIADEFISRFHQFTKRLIIDHPIKFEKAPFMGPLIDQQSTDNYLNFMGMAKREGFEEIMRGKQIEKKTRGYFVTPSIHLGELNQIEKSIFASSELFGPNCTFVKYDNIEEAVMIANNSEYGLASSVFSSDQEIHQYCLNNIDAGQVNINRSTVGASSALPFGGVKSSGNYRPASVAFIDSCVYAKSSLKLNETTFEDPNKMVGIE